MFKHTGGNELLSTEAAYLQGRLHGGTSDVERGGFRVIRMWNSENPVFLD